ncbi:flagellar protein FliS [Geomicrobium halophilum]|uniref:Flagellar secretion chaperone FliS n=1 Tax=Geomicrobium halophilum TaxID=549000 RepID=A0A841Q297_9BACL|nr:flagellar export chaperone FliS [Geomicrobium halophilum]MBB6450368.1 flagellar protein FliS [Geomicrobium halophilum]
MKFPSVGTAQQQNVYKQNSFQTASPGELTLMLYNGCLKFIRLAEGALESRDYEATNVNITKAQKIIRELMVTLRIEDETTQQMLQLYDFAYDALVRANVHNDVKALKEAKSIINSFRDTWLEVIQIDRKHRFASGAHV